MAQMPEIGVHAVGPRFGYRHGNAAFFRIIDGVFPRTDVPQPPRRNNLQMRSQRLDGQLEPDLVVALAGCAVGNGHRAFLFGNAGQRLGDDRPRHRGTQQVFPFVHRTGFQRGPDVFGNERFPQILHKDLAGAGFDRLLFDKFQVVALADVGAYGDDFVTVVFDQPGNDDGSIQAARIGQYYFFRFRVRCVAHNRFPPKSSLF